MQTRELNIPVLTDIIRANSSTDSVELETLLVEVQTKLASRTFKLADELLRTAFAEMEATLFERLLAVVFLGEEPLDQFAIDQPARTPALERFLGGGVRHCSVGICSAGRCPGSRGSSASSCDGQPSSSS